MTIKVINMGTGQQGICTIEEVIRRPELELVGLYAYSDWKVGQDASDILNGVKGMVAAADSIKAMGYKPAPPFEKTGVTATNSFDEILAIDADLVIYNALGASEDLHEEDERIRALMRSGKNVITPIGYNFPWLHGDEFAKSFEDAGKEGGGTTLFCAGINPGFLCERMLVTLASNCLDINGLSFRECSNVGEVASPAFLFKLMGIGQPLESFEDKYGDRELAFTRYFTEVTAYVGNALGIEYDSIEMDHEYGVTDKEIKTRAGPVPAGTVVNFRRNYYGIKDGERFSHIEIVWVLDEEMEGFRDLPDGWNFGISGRPGFEMRIDPKNPDWESYPGAWFGTQLNVAGPAFRAIPEVLQAGPGVLLPPPVFGSYKHNRLL